MDVLDQLDTFIAERTPEGRQARPVIAKVNYSHDAMIDMILAQPGISQNEIALRFGYTPGWISQVMASDAFQARLAERSSEVVDPLLRATVKERFDGLVLRSLEILRDKLDRPSSDIPDQLALRALEISSRARGYGGKDEVPPQTNVSVEVHLESLGANLTTLLRRRKAEVIDSTEAELLSEAPVK